LMAKYGVRTIEEARRKEVEEQQQRRMEVERLRREAEERQRQEVAATRAGWATQLDANSGKQFWAHAQSGASQRDVPTAVQLRQQDEEETARRKEARLAKQDRVLAAAIGAGTVAVYTIGVSGGSSRCRYSSRSSSSSNSSRSSSSAVAESAVG
jgi:hypothetical protein